MVVAFKQIFCSKKKQQQKTTTKNSKQTKTKQNKKKTKQNKKPHFEYFLVYEFLQNLNFSQLQILFQTTSTN